jgi:hypothetical protein
LGGSKKKGDHAIQNWIDSQLKMRSCTVVLIGAQTAERRWVQHEIQKSWEEEKGVVGIHIHNSKDKQGNPSEKGANPFDKFSLLLPQGKTKPLSNVVETYDPPCYNSTEVYNYIKNNLSDWVEKAIKIRRGMNHARFWIKTV